MKKKGNEKQYMREYMRKQRKQGQYKKYSDEYNKKITDKRHEYKRKAIEIKGSKCARCGESFHDECYDFHHTEPGEKDLNIAKAFTEKQWNAIEKELRKCIMVCSNCHRVIHKEQKYSHLSKKAHGKIKIQIDLF